MTGAVRLRLKYIKEHLHVLIVWQPPSVRLPNIVLKLIFFFANVRALCEKKKKRKKNKPYSCLTGGSITSIVYLEVSP